MGPWEWWFLLLHLYPATQRPSRACLKWEPGATRTLLASQDSIATLTCREGSFPLKTWPLLTTWSQALFFFFLPFEFLCPYLQNKWEEGIQNLLPESCEVAQLIYSNPPNNLSVSAFMNFQFGEVRVTKGSSFHLPLPPKIVLACPADPQVSTGH
jgi:hypothetical protein